MNLARDMKEEHRRVLMELGVTELKNKSFKVQKELLLLKRRVAVLLLGKVVGREKRSRVEMQGRLRLDQTSR